VLDESTAALDLESAQRLYAEVQRLRDEGVCVLVVTHRIAELVMFADRVTVLRDGIDVGDLGADEINEEALLSLMSGERVTQTATSPQPPARPTRESAPALLRAQSVVAVPGAAPSDMVIHAGEIIGFAGLDGQGQSPFLQALVGVGRALEGEISATTGSDFVSVNGLESAERAGLAYVSGDRRKYGIFPNLDIFENFAMHHYRHHRRHGVIDRDAVLKRFEAEVADLSIKTGDQRNLITSLSGGNQQKVLIARAITSSPRVIALDDPARGVDVGTKRELYGHLRELAAEGSAVVYLSTEIDEFIGLCHRVAVFRDGHLFAWVEGEQLTTDNILAAMFGHLESGFNVEEELGGIV
jgi:ribose transport system ATP-binding protein